MKHFLFFLAICFPFLVFSQGEIPVTEKEVAFNSSDGLSIKGTLSIPENSKDIVILVAGSGPTDRNGNSPGGTGNNSLKMLAQGLFAKGIGVLRYDKRTSGKTAKGLNKEQRQSLNFDNFIEDASSAIQFLDKEYGTYKLHILGHSQGGLVANLAALKNPGKITTYTALAAPAESADDILTRQLALSDSGKEELKKIFETIREGKTLAPKDLGLKMVMPESAQPFIGSWMKYKPLNEIQKLDASVLVIQGDKDMQVPVKDAGDLAKISGTYPIIIKDVNHVLKIVGDKQDNLYSYNDATRPISNELVSKISHHIKSGKITYEEKFLTDETTGKTYEVIKHNDLLWMNENLFSDSETTDCIEGKPENCQTQGSLFYYDEAQEACPLGWRLPNDEDWTSLLSDVKTELRTGKDVAHLSFYTSLTQMDWEQGKHKSGIQLGFYGWKHKKKYDVGGQANLWLSEKDEENMVRHIHIRSVNQEQAYPGN